MKKMLLFMGIGLMLGSVSSCKKYKNKEVYANVPVYQDYSTFRASFEFIEGQQPVQTPGNIYIHNEYILVCDEDKGIHVVNNVNANDPYFVGFMNIPGVSQMAIKDNYLYANSFMDLLVIDLSNISSPQLITRAEEVFTYSTPAIDDQYPVADIDKEKGVVVSWNIEKTKNVSGFGKKYFVSDCEDCEKEEIQAKSSSSVRVNLAGSRAKFAIIGNYLYALDNNDLKSFNISSPTSPKFKYSKDTWAEPETLFPNEEFLFVGTTTGMKIYDTESDRDNPKYISEVEHVESCDPVVVQGNYAYVTLRSGSDCGGIENELQVIDISNIYLPKLKKQFDMSDPHGLAVEGPLLFVCDGSEGLKIFNNAVPLNSGYNMMFNFPAVQTSDVILNNGIAIMIAEEGVYQYDYTNPSNMHMISMLNF